MPVSAPASVAGSARDVVQESAPGDEFGDASRQPAPRRRAGRRAPAAGRRRPPADSRRPSRTPTKAPGRVTSPTVRVWSSGGTRAVAPARRVISSTASRRSSPRARAASTSPRRWISSSRSRRPASEVAVIAPPIEDPRDRDDRRTAERHGAARQHQRDDGSGAGDDREGRGQQSRCGARSPQAQPRDASSRRDRGDGQHEQDERGGQQQRPDDDEEYRRDRRELDGGPYRRDDDRAVLTQPGQPAGAGGQRGQGDQDDSEARAHVDHRGTHGADPSGWPASCPCGRPRASAERGAVLARLVLRPVHPGDQRHRGRAVPEEPAVRTVEVPVQEVSVPGADHHERRGARLAEHLAGAGGR